MNRTAIAAPADDAHARLAHLLRRLLVRRWLEPYFQAALGSAYALYLYGDGSEQGLDGALGNADPRMFGGPR